METDWFPFTADGSLWKRTVPSLGRMGPSSRWPGLLFGAA
ncbi:hypothetical protein COLSTE_00013 [Collinsella stercoris DSM 13279]|uniref:Uncharacterized protein n=1 Tax=Collinsella stercoris DSM 13279 TaxID=445975 RepID=B6G7H4_9ACTN|nr:hypothetical protein COLSTE_00013 [Collinsella stercoris DSM 13279]